MLLCRAAATGAAQAKGMGISSAMATAQTGTVTTMAYMGGNHHGRKLKGPGASSPPP